MKKRTALLVALTSIAILSACATTKAEDIKICSPAEPKQSEYERVALLWVGSWRTAFWVPTYSSRDDGIAALRDKAAAIDANGLTNVDCYGDRGLFGAGVPSRWDDRVYAASSKKSTKALAAVANPLERSIPQIPAL